MFSDYSGESFCSCCCPTSYDDVEEEAEPKVVSEIATKGRPYKEIEAIINDHRMVIRMQKEHADEEYDPPCDCLENSDPSQKRSSSSIEQKARDGVIFEMTDSGQTERPQSSRTRKGREKQEDDKTTTVYRDSGSKESSHQARPSVARRPTSAGSKGHEKKKEKEKQEKKVRTVPVEENPNIFLLRITKKSENGDKKRKFDLEFRAPRPWTHKPDDKEKKGKKKGEEKKEAESVEMRKSKEEDAKKEVAVRKKKEKAKKRSRVNKKLKSNTNQPKRRSDC